MPALLPRSFDAAIHAHSAADTGWSRVFTARARDRRDGRTGSLVYANLRADPRIGDVRRSCMAEQSGQVLNCTRCDATEGIYVGDITHHRP